MSAGEGRSLAWVIARAGLHARMGGRKKKLYAAVIRLRRRGSTHGQRPVLELAVAIASSGWGRRLTEWC